MYMYVAEQHSRSECSQLYICIERYLDLPLLLYYVYRNPLRTSEYYLSPVEIGVRVNKERHMQMPSSSFLGTTSLARSTKEGRAGRSSLCP